MQQIIPHYIVLYSLIIGLSYSCQQTPPPKPLQAMHKLDTDTLKVLLKGSPPFALQLSKEDSTIATQTMDSIGVMKVFIKDLATQPGEYSSHISSSGGDTTFVFTIEKPKPIAKNKTPRSTTKKRAKTKTKISREWSKWKRSGCYYEVWYRYRVWRHNPAYEAYKYEYQIYNGYNATIVLRAALIDSNESAEYQSQKTNRADMTNQTTRHTIRSKQYSYHNRVTLLTNDPTLFTWRLQSPNPISPYIDCGH